MKILHAYCAHQHRSAILPVLEEMRRRGHEVKEVMIQGGTLEPYPDQEDVSNFHQDVFINSYPHIMETGQGVKYAYQTGLKVCVEHGVNPVAWAFPLDRHLLYDVVCLAGKWQLDAVKSGEYAERLLPKCVLTGWPKVDALSNVTFQERIEARARLEKKMTRPFTNDPVIAFVPTHGGAWYRVDELRRLGIPNLIVAPHEGRYPDFHKAPESVRELEINYADEYPYYIETSDIYEVLKASDLVISDYSSAMLEALVFGLPIIQLLCDVELHNRAGINPMNLGYYPLSQNDPREFRIAPNVSAISDVTKFIKTLFSNPNYFAKSREYWKNELFHDIGNATENVCDTIESKIK